MKNNDWIVVVPSYNRADGFKNKTLATLQHLHIDPKKIHLFVANDEQKKLYEDTIPKHSVGHIIIGEKGLVNVRNFIFRHFPKGTKIVSFDDDVREFVRLDPSTNKLRPITPKEFTEFVDLAFQECEKVGAHFWGDYPVPNAFFMENSISYDLKFIIGSFWGCINPGKDIQIRIGNGEKEDYQRAIHFWEADHAIVRLNFLSHKTATYNESGGLQSDGVQARIERENSTVNTMLSKWPQYIRRNPRRKGPFPEILFIRQPFQGSRKRHMNNTQSKNKTRKQKHI
jgi:hypothetical protein